MGGEKGDQGKGGHKGKEGGKGDEMGDAKGGKGKGGEKGEDPWSAGNPILAAIAALTETVNKMSLKTDTVESNMASKTDLDNFKGEILEST